jgi:DNA-binding response OmpR family regulator
MHRQLQSAGAQPGREGWQGASVPGSSLRGWNILVVEDDPLIAMDLEGMLEVAGATVIGPAYEVRDTLNLIENSPIGAAVLDYRLQNGTTLPLARLLTERGIPFVFQTSDPLNAARDNPGATVIPKPFPSRRLISSLQALLVPASKATA